MSSTNRITLFKYEVYLTYDNKIQVDSSLLEQGDWDAAIEDLEEYENAHVVSNFLAYLKKVMDSINIGVTTYF
jgi:hypothetical protein|tara:strand:- start:176 stop:394 length:219 start_codon:yes stop_codon:yes gene_type:complete